jgi:hypothetical protein
MARRRMGGLESAARYTCAPVPVDGLRSPDRDGGCGAALCHADPCRRSAALCRHLRQNRRQGARLANGRDLEPRNAAAESACRPLRPRAPRARRPGPAADGARQRGLLRRQRRHHHRRQADRRCRPASANRSLFSGDANSRRRHAHARSALSPGPRHDQGRGPGSPPAPMMFWPPALGCRPPFSTKATPSPR